MIPLFLYVYVLTFFIFYSIDNNYVVKVAIVLVITFVFEMQLIKCNVNNAQQLRQENIIRNAINKR